MLTGKTQKLRQADPDEHPRSLRDPDDPCWTTSGGKLPPTPTFSSSSKNLNITLWLYTVHTSKNISPNNLNITLDTKSPSSHFLKKLLLSSLYHPTPNFPSFKSNDLSRVALFLHIWITTATHTWSSLTFFREQ